MTDRIRFQFLRFRFNLCLFVILAEMKVKVTIASVLAKIIRSLLYIAREIYKLNLPSIARPLNQSARKLIDIEVNVLNSVKKMGKELETRIQPIKFPQA